MAIISNKKAYFNYEIERTFVSGIELFGHEVKSLRKSQGSLDGSYVIIRGGEAYLIGSYIPPYQPNNIKGTYDEKRQRKLLLKKSEIKELADIDSNKKNSIIPLSIFPAGRKLKIEIAVAHGKKKFDKRESLKKRDMDREIRREIKKGR